MMTRVEETNPANILFTLACPEAAGCSIGARPAMSMMGGAHGGGLIGLYSASLLGKPMRTGRGWEGRHPTKRGIPCTARIACPSGAPRSCWWRPRREHAPRSTPKALLQKQFETLARGDVAGALALYTDDALVDGAGLCAAAPCVGKAAIQKEFEHRIANKMQDDRPQLLCVRHRRDHAIRRPQCLHPASWGGPYHRVGDC